MEISAMLKVPKEKILIIKHTNSTTSLLIVNDHAYYTVCNNNGTNYLYICILVGSSLHIFQVFKLCRRQRLMWEYSSIAHFDFDACYLFKRKHFSSLLSSRPPPKKKIHLDLQPLYYCPCLLIG
jgi:hypothetical protein